MPTCNNTDYYTYTNTNSIMYVDYIWKDYAKIPNNSNIPWYEKKKEKPINEQHAEVF